MDKKTAFYILGLNENSSKEFVKKRFKTLAKKIHPDFENGDQDLYRIVNEAYKYILENCYEEEKENIVSKKRHEMKIKEQPNSQNIIIEKEQYIKNSYSTAENKQSTKNKTVKIEKQANKTEPIIKYNTTKNSSRITENKDVNSYEEIIKDRRNKLKSFSKKNVSEIKPILTKEDIKDISPTTIVIGNNILTAQQNEKNIYTIENIYNEIVESDFITKNNENEDDEGKLNEHSKFKICFNLKELQHLAKYGFIEKKAIKNNSEQRVRFLATEVFSNFNKIYYLKDEIKICTKNSVTTIPFEVAISPYSIMTTVKYKISDGKHKVIVFINEHKQTHSINKNKKFTQTSFVFDFKLEDIRKYFETFAGIFLTIEIS